MSLKITKRKLTLQEAEIISREISHTNNIIGYKAAELTNFPNTFVAISNSKLVGISTYVELKDWIDRKILIILEEYRGQGYGRKLFDYSIAQTRKLNKSTYTVTRNPAIVKLLEEKGFKRTNLFRLPPPVILHQMKLIFSVYRIKEYLRKLPQIKSGPRFQYFELSR